MDAEQAEALRQNHSVLVVIPCLNESRTIRDVVGFAVRDLGELPGEIVVVDGMSTDGTADIVEELARTHANVHLLPNPRRIQSAAVNLAVEVFGQRHTCLVRLDAHADYPAGFIGGAIATAELRGCDVVVVPMETRGRTCFQRSVAIAQNSLLGNGGSPHRNKGRSGWVDHGHHAFIMLDAFRAVGGYDATFSHNEDAELDSRLIKDGRRIWLEASLEMTYYPRSAPLPLFRQYMRYGQGRARTLLKHRMRPKLRQVVPAFVLPSVILALLPVPFASAPMLAWLGLSLAIGLYSGIKSGDRCGLLAGVAAIIMHAGWSLGFWTTMVGRQKPVPPPSAPRVSLPRD